MSARRFKDASSALFAIVKTELDPYVFLTLSEKGESDSTDEYGVWETRYSLFSCNGNQTP